MPFITRISPPQNSESGDENDMGIGGVASYYRIYYVIGCFRKSFRLEMGIRNKIVSWREIGIVVCKMRFFLV